MYLILNTSYKEDMKNLISKAKKIASFIPIIIVIIFLFTKVNGESNMQTVKAASDKEVDIRLIFTTDNHGQINSKDFETGGEYSEGGLAKAYTLIEQARSEKYKNNSFTFDIGDNLFDFTTEYIFSENQKELQPIYKAVAQVGYDAITLGNHDLDYGYDYILNQLEQAGLTEKVIVSNLYDSKTDKNPLKENMIITRNVTAEDGTVVKVKVGIIGEILPTLSTKTEDYTGILKTEDIVNNVTKEAKKLKNEGADIIVVLSHSGMGPENPEVGYNNVSYALTKINEVDVVLCGHEHNMFPTKDHSSPYYKLSGVDLTTGLVNGKNLVMSADRGKSIGVVDLTLQKNSSGYTIVNRSSEVRQVKESTAENKKISDSFGSWEDVFSGYYENDIASVDANKKITNFFGLVQDNSSIQLVNDAKMAYALDYVNNVNTKYKDYYIIAASKYARYGQNSYKDYVNLSGKITEADLAAMEDYNNYLALYVITGKELKEWLEWSASAYENVSSQSSWVGNTMEDLTKNYQIPSLLKQDWVNDWSNFTVFDGIEYEIDPSVEARYDQAGNKINDTNRIKNLSYNGVPVTDAMQFLLSSDRITQTTEATKGLDTKYIKRGYNRSQSIIADYIRLLAKNGTVKVTPDYNWKLQFNAAYQYIVKASTLSDSIASTYPWFVKKLEAIDNYIYYIGRGTNTVIDTTAPHIVAFPLTTISTNQNVQVAVKASDSSNIASLRYAYGTYALDDTTWFTASTIMDGTFTANRNGTYSIYAEDNAGNKNVVQITIDNINTTILQKPKVDTYTNRKTKITGTAEPLADIYFETDTKTYQSKVSADGTFSYALPAQLGNTKLNVYVKDSTGRVSDKTVVKVKTTGPNAPTVDTFTNKLTKLTGDTRDDTVSVFAIIDSKVYVSNNGGEKAFEDSEKYDATLEVIGTTVSIAKNGKYSIKVPLQLPDTEISVYTVDHLHRVSRVVKVTTMDVAPNAPTIYDITNIERTVYGNVYNSSGKEQVYNIELTIGDDLYNGVTDENGNFEVPVSKLSVGDVVKVKAIDYVDGKARTSYTSSKKVVDISKYVDNKQESFVIDKVNNKNTTLSGYYAEGEDTIFVSINKTVYEVPTDEDGNFLLDLDKTIPAGTSIYIYSRYVDGDIIDVNEYTVALAKPDKPSLEKSRITNASKVLKILTDQNSKVTVKVGDKTYTTSTYVYDSSQDAYVYTVTITKANSGTDVKIYATNKAGTSSVYRTTIVKTAPNTPKVEAIYEGAKVITGTVDIVEVTDSDEEQVTKIFVQIGSKIYEGKVSDTGKFNIKVPKLVKNTKIYLWGENVSGRGPTKVIKVKAK